MRSYEEHRFDSSDGIHRCFYIVMRPDGEPKGVVQISHGMCEYIERYVGFMDFLADNGYVVCGNDHIGHGKTVDFPEELGYFSPENGWQNAVKDLHRLNKIMKREYPTLPYFMLGHSMGSFLARAYAVKYAHSCDAYIFMGTSDGFENTISEAADKGAGAAGSIGSKLREKLDGKENKINLAAITFMLGQAEAIKKIKGDKYHSKTLDKLGFGSYNARIDDVKTGYEWVSRDEEIVAKYAVDPLCNYSFSVNGYINLASVLWYVNNEKWYQNMPKDIPLLLCAGTADPVGSYSEGVKNVYHRLCEYRCDASLKLYEGARHELLNEINRQEVYEDMLAFFNSNLDK